MEQQLRKDLSAGKETLVHTVVLLDEMSLLAEEVSAAGRPGLAAELLHCIEEWMQGIPEHAFFAASLRRTSSCVLKPLIIYWPNGRWHSNAYGIKLFLRSACSALLLDKLHVAGAFLGILSAIPCCSIAEHGLIVQVLCVASKFGGQSLPGLVCLPTSRISLEEPTFDMRCLCCRRTLDAASCSKRC